MLVPPALRRLVRLSNGCEARGASSGSRVLCAHAFRVKNPAGISRTAAVEMCIFLFFFFFCRDIPRFWERYGLRTRPTHTVLRPLRHFRNPPGLPPHGRLGSNIHIVLPRILDAQLRSLCMRWEGFEKDAQFPSDGATNKGKKGGINRKNVNCCTTETNHHTSSCSGPSFVIVEC